MDMADKLHLTCRKGGVVRGVQSDSLVNGTDAEALNRRERILRGGDYTGGMLTNARGGSELKSQQEPRRVETRCFRDRRGSGMKVAELRR